MNAAGSAVAYIRGELLVFVLVFWVERLLGNLSLAGGHGQ